jgi:twitching motility protein PilT
MPDYLHDEALDALIRELNRGRQPEEASGTTPVGHPLGATRRIQVREGEPLETLLLQMVSNRASDVLLVPHQPPVMRVDGRLSALGTEPVVESALREWFTPHLGAHAAEGLEAHGSADFSLRLFSSETERSWRFRVNLHRQKGQLAAALRALPGEIPTLAALNLPPALGRLAERNHGLVLVCGPTGCGKTSTLAALVGQINRTRACHILTIEDPIEYDHASDRAIIEQIEVGTDTPEFAAALKSSLRQDPDVILVGEMRDLETVATALTAAETGHLILSTLHTNDAAQTVHRIVDVFPPDQQAQIRQQLALSLSAIVCQQLVPRCDGPGRVPAVEILTANYAVRQHVRSGKHQNLYNEITMGLRDGMVSLEASLARLIKAGAVDLEEARLRASHPEELDSLLRN